MENNLINNFRENINRNPGKKEIIIVIILAVIFLGVFSAAMWDLYGKNLLCKCDCANSAAVSEPNQDSVAVSQENVNASQVSTIQPAVNNSQGTNKTKGTGATAKVDSNIAYSSYSTCIENAKDLATSKDCCDCLSGDASLHKACRDYAATYDFSKNTVFKTFDIPSTLGQNGDYSACTASGTQQQCKQCCENSGNFVCGDFRFCRTACASLPQ